MLEVISFVFDYVNTYINDNINIISVLSPILIFLISTLFNIKSEKDMQQFLRENVKEIRKSLDENNNRQLAFHKDATDEMLSFHKKSDSDREQFYKYLAIEQNRPYIAINPYPIDIALSDKDRILKGLPKRKITLGKDFTSGESINTLYLTGEYLDNPMYYLDMVNLGVNGAINIFVEYHIEFRNNVLSKISDKIDRIRRDEDSDFDIDSFVKKSDGCYVVMSTNFGSILKLEGLQMNVSNLGRGDEIVNPLDKSIILLQQVLFGVDLASSDNNGYKMTDYSDDVYLLCNISYDDVRGNSYYDVWELSTHHDYSEHGYEVGYKDAHFGIKKYIYPKKVDQKYYPSNFSTANTLGKGDQNWQ